MRWFPLFLGILATGAVLPARAASFGNSDQEKIVCGGADMAEEKGTAPKRFGEAVQNIFTAAQSQQPTPFTANAAGALHLEQMRLNFIQKNRLSPVGNGQPPYRKEVDEKGNPIHVFELMYTLTKRWDDEEFVRKQVEKACQTYYPEVADFCVDSFFKRRENVKAFLDKHKSYIENESNWPKNGETWADKFGDHNFDRDDITDNNLRWNASPTLPVDVVVNGFGGVPVQNENNQVVGFMVDIEVEGQNKSYFAELRGDEVLWPYFFIFGSPSSDEWNQIFEKRHGKLKVGALPLAEWQQMRASLK